MKIINHVIYKFLLKLRIRLIHKKRKAKKEKEISKKRKKII